MSACETIKVKPWGDDQGDHVLINAEDFDPAIHTKFEADAPAQTRAKPRSKKDA